MQQGDEERRPGGDLGARPERSMHRRDPSQMRVSDADRHRVAELLREAAGEGRLDLDELDERLEAAYSAKTYADLLPITVDLPGHPAQPVVPPSPTSGLPVPHPSSVRRQVVPAVTTYDTSVAVMGECSRRGAWLVPARHQAFALMGSVTLDLREATFAAREVTIVANALMAGIDVVVDAYTHVVVDGVGIMGDFSQSRDKVPAELGADSPTVRVKGVALMAGVNVVRKPPPGSFRRKILG